MTSNVPALDLRANYTLKRIALFHSSQAAYVTFPIDQSATLTGGNNKGKSSALRAIKFFLLPEVNLNHMERKFAFVGKNGAYDTPSSFKHYFPTNRSFLILEGENTAGPYCQVLHQGREQFSYERIFVPVAYQEIENIFWHDDETANGGQGSPTECTHAQAWEKLKAMGGIRINTRASLRDALYTRETPTNSETRYCMFPIPGKATDAHVESLRALLNLVFGVSKDHLPLAVATLIDQSLSGSSDNKIQIDLARITDEHQLLRGQENHLRTLRRLQPHWKALQSLTLRFHVRHEDIKKRYATHYAQAAHLKEKATLEYAPVSEKQSGLREENKKIRAEISEAKTQQSVITGQLKNQREQLARMQQSERQYRDLRGQYASLEGLDTDDDIIAYLKTDEQGGLSTAQDRLKAATNAQEMTIQQNRNFERRAVIVEEIKQWEDAQQKNVDPLLDQIDPETAGVLISLNPKLANVRVDIQPDDRATLDRFGHLFSEVHGQLQIKSVAIPGVSHQAYCPDDAASNALAQPASLRKKRDNLDGKISAAVKFLSSSAADRLEQVAKLKDKIKDIENDISVLRAGEPLKQQVEDEVRRVTESEGELEKAESTLDSVSKRYTSNTGNLKKTSDEVLRLEECMEKAAMTTQKLKSIATQSSQLLREPLEGPSQLPSDTDVDPMALHKETEVISTDISSLMQLQYDAYQYARQLSDAEIGNTESLSDGTIKLGTKEYDDIYRIYAGEFDNIDGLDKKLRQAIAAHNHTTSTQMKIIQKMESAVKSFGDAINAEVADVKISDLDSFQVKLVTEGRFSSLCRDLKKQDAPTAIDTMLSEDFYNGLQAFCTEFLATRAGQARMDMTKIIKGVEFIYQKNGVPEKKPQSDGTTSMVNAILLSVLMRRMTPSDVKIRMPIMFDEAGTIDHNNFPALVKSVEEHGYALFAAAPNLSMVMARDIGIHHNLSLFLLTDQDLIAPECEAIYRDNADIMKRLIAAEG
ncbi:MAG: hypothetical protein QS748_03335 [Candidatus Endonucleobacter bathymodioli]|uniref:Uncharacterized protein n=1 Tax=Candidatus Endonucleibacter bathymodioli TaxID=539814 RepID=A0AA90SX38_9GAMM|nr:hypothetical protein [Candidatus Endonucleobacter bathymodioli]